MPPARLRFAAKAVLALRIWFWLAALPVAVRRRPLPELIRRLGRARPRAATTDPVRLGKIVHRAVAFGRWQPRCLYQALILYRLLRAQGDRAELVIGLPREPRDKDAHAWVEIDGVDVGPPPGRALHEELARYR